MRPPSIKTLAPKKESLINSSPRDVPALMNAAYSQLEIGRRIKITWQSSNDTAVPDAEIKFKLL